MQPKKEDLIQELNTLETSTYGELLDFIHHLKKKNEKSTETNPLLQYGGQLSDTDLSEPHDPLPEALDAF